MSGFMDAKVKRPGSGFDPEPENLCSTAVVQVCQNS